MPTALPAGASSSAGVLLRSRKFATTMGTPQGLCRYCGRRGREHCCGEVLAAMPAELPWT
jgi:hypothetical protein